MLLNLHFRVDQRRITPADVAWLRRCQRELASIAASVAFLDFAADHDAVLREYFSKGDGLSWFSRDTPWTPRQSLEPVETARDICSIAHGDEWMMARWPMKVHLWVLRAHTLTRSEQSGDVTITTRLALPTGVNDLCHALLTRVIDTCLLDMSLARVAPYDPRDPDDPMRAWVRRALDIRFAAEPLKGWLEKCAAFEVSRLSPIPGPYPDLTYGRESLDTELFARLFGADCTLDNRLEESDADIGFDRW